MKRTLCLLIFLFFVLPLSVFCQDKVQSMITSEMCSCLITHQQQKALSMLDMKNCLKSTMESQMPLINEELLRIYGRSATYEQGSEYGAKLARHIDTAMVYTCDTYFQAIDSLRFTFVLDYNQDSLQISLAQYKDSSLPRKAGYFTERAKLHFFTAHYKESLQDMKEAERLSGNKYGLLILKGLAHDRLGQYKEAAAIFYRIASIEKVHNYLVHAAIENRKAMGIK